MENDAGGRLVCPHCATQIAPKLLSCPACGWLVHGRELKQLAQEADEARSRGELTAALSAWRRAQDLLPMGSRQFDAVAAKVEDLSRRVDQSPAATAKRSRRPAWAKGGGALAALGLLLWKLKAVFAFVLTKGKVLLLGLTKSSTLFSMLLSAGLYWTIWGWKFALGLVVAIYIHEMGHVVALRRFGIHASAPMFIPGIGAVVRLRQYPANPREDARVGLAGPIWGLGSVLAAYALYHLTGWTSLAAIARFSAWINLFNLLPVWQLDGSRGFRALGRLDRWLVAAAMGVMWYLTGETLLVLLAIAGGVRALAGRQPEHSDRTALWQFVVLVVLLSGFSAIEVPGIGEAP
ncbi:MAG: site-2 protease family protein [bacterium]|nr:site-2 protease family protein [bacterium]